MFTRKDAKLIQEIVLSYLPKELAEDEDIIIAGGFAINAFVINEILQSEAKEAKSILRNRFILENQAIPFSDIDLWILKNSNSESKFLFEKSEPSEMRKSILSEPQIESNGMIKKYKSRLSPVKSSYLANTFNILPGLEVKNKNKKVHTMQCMLSHKESPEELISEFDLGLSSIAIHRGEFIIHESFFKSIKSKEILFNKAPSNYGLSSRIYHAMRYFKYTEKVDFQFSKEVYNYVMSAMIDSNTVISEGLKSGSLIKIGEDLFINNNVVVENSEEDGDLFASNPNSEKLIITNGKNYEHEISTRESLLIKIKSLFNMLNKIKKMDHWNDIDALFLVDSKIVNAKSLLESESC